MRTGTQTPSARRRRQVSKPSRPGIITSSTIASYSVARAQPQRLLAAAREVDDEPLEAQPAPDGGRHPHVVLDDEHPHPPTIARLRRS